MGKRAFPPLPTRPQLVAVYPALFPLKSSPSPRVNASSRRFFHWNLIHVASVLRFALCSSLYVSSFLPFISSFTWFHHLRLLPSSFTFPLFIIPLLPLCKKNVLHHLQGYRFSVACYATTPRICVLRIEKVWSIPSPCLGNVEVQKSCRRPFFFFQSSFIFRFCFGL